MKKVIRFPFCVASVRMFEHHQGIHPDDSRVSGLWSEKITGELEGGGALFACKANPRVVYIVCAEDREIRWYTTRIESIVAHKKHLKAFVRIDVLRYKNSLKK